MKMFSRNKPSDMAEDNKRYRLPTKNAVLLLGLAVFYALGSYCWGYTIGIIGTLYINPGFIKTLHKPTPAQTGTITAIYYLGTWISFVFLCHQVSDRFGRRAAAWTGAFITGIGTILICTARGPGSYAMMICGRIICGFGTAFITTSVPLYLSEISPAAKRGRYTIANHTGFVAGLACAFWVSYGLSFWKHGYGYDHSWRITVAAVYGPLLIFLVGIPFTPESPRWLIKHERYEQAKKVLMFLRSTKDEAEVRDEFNDIKNNLDWHKEHSLTSSKELFKNSDLFARLWRVALLQFMAQFAGSTVMKYYLTTNFLALGLSRQFALLAGGIESTLKIFCTIFSMLVVDKMGRKNAITFGSTVMAIALLINAILPIVYPKNINKASDTACIVFIFFFTFGYSIGLGPTTWVYGTEIFPTHLRAKGLSIAASGGSIGSIVVAQIWPISFAHIGSRTYFIFFTVNLLVIAAIWLFYPETKGKTLEEIDNIFGNAESVPGTHATEAVRQGRTSFDVKEDRKDMVVVTQV